MPPPGPASDSVGRQGAATRARRPRSAAPRIRIQATRSPGSCIAGTMARHPRQSRQDAEGRGDAGLGLARVGGAVDAVHPRAARMAAIERKTKRYPTDLTDEEWARIAPLLPEPAKRGREPGVDLCQVLDAIRYMTRTGGGWRMLPKDFPPRQTVYWWFRRFVRLMLFRTIHDIALMLARNAPDARSVRASGSSTARRWRPRRRGLGEGMTAARKRSSANGT